MFFSKPKALQELQQNVPRFIQKKHMLHFCLTTWSSSRGVYVLYLVHDDHFAVFLKSPPSGVPLLASLVADHPKSGPSAPISGGLDYVMFWNENVFYI